MENTINPLKSTASAIFLGLVVLSIAILMHGGVIKVGKPVMAPSAQAPTPAQPSQPAEPQVVDVEGLRDNDHILGSKSARVLLIEYSDLECPFCKRFHPTGQQVLDAYEGQVAWVYRHFPLSQIHPKAQKLAEAAECVVDQGGNDSFWKFADAVFATETTPEISALGGIVAKLGYDQNKFKTCLDGGEKASYVDSDYQSGVKAGVNGTPGNILLDTKTGKTIPIPGAVPFETLKTSIDSLLKS